MARSPSFPNSIWERLLPFAKLHFALIFPGGHLSRRDDRTLAGGKTAKRSPPPECIPEKPTLEGVAELWHPYRGAVA